MAVTITGSKYGVLALAGVGTSTVTIAAPTFSSGDFGAPRSVGLYSAANAFKGLAFVRRFTSTTVLELEAAFVDPVTGIAPPQLITDKILVSKNFAESVTAGLAITGNFVTMTDNLAFGSGSAMDVCFHDESKKMYFAPSSTGGQASNTGVLLKINSGLVTFGHLQDWSQKAVYGGIDIYYDTPTFYLGCSPTGPYADFFCFGGDHENNNIVIWEGGRALASANSQVYMRVLFGLDALTNTDGGAWSSNASRQVLFNCDAVASGQLGIGVRWGDGVVQGGSVKVRGEQCIGALGSFVSGNQTSNVAAPPGQYYTIADVKPGTAPGYGATGLWDSAGQSNGTVNFTNVISATRTQGRAGSNTTFNWYWAQQYTNMAPGTLLAVARNDTLAVVASAVSDGSGNATITLLEQTQNGGSTVLSTTLDLSAWTYGAKAYGYAPLSAAINRTQRDQGTAGQANIVVFGGALVQLPDTSVTLSLTAANALTSISTLSQLMDALKAWSVASVANAEYPTLGTYLANANGTDLNLGVCNFVLDPTAGSVISVNTGTNTITIKATSLVADAKFKRLVATGLGSFINGGVVGTLPYQDSTGATTLLTVTGLTAANVYVGNNANVQQAYATNQTGTYQFLIPASGTGTWRVVIDRAGYDRKVFAPAANGIAQSFDGSLFQPLDFGGVPLYQGQSNTLITIVADSPAAGNYRIDVGDGTVTASAVYDAVENFLITATGMASANLAVDFLPTSNGVYLALGTYVKLRRRSAGDNNSAVNGIVSQASGMPIDGANGPVAIQAASTQLTLQQIRDALALDLGLGVVPVTGSVDTQLVKIKLDTGLIAALL